MGKVSTLDELLDLKEQQKRPLVVVHCGSVRRAGVAFEEWRRRDTLMGYVVLTVGVGKHDGSGLTDAQCVWLDLLHLWKIDLADIVRILNVDGYIGESTRRELEYAQRLGKQIEFVQYAPVALPGIHCSLCLREGEVLYPCVYCSILVCSYCSSVTDERDKVMGVVSGCWVCPVCSHEEP